MSDVCLPLVPNSLLLTFKSELSQGKYVLMKDHPFRGNPSSLPVDSRGL